MIPYGRHEITQQDIDAVTSVLNSAFLTQGPVVPSFEAEVAKFCGAYGAVAVNSATSALHIACLALGLQRGDVAWTTPNSFVATANAILYTGAKVDFVDIELDSYNMDIAQLERKLELAETNGELPRVVIVVHFAGQVMDMMRIQSLAKKYRFKIIEDASHAVGSSYQVRNSTEATGSNKDQNNWVKVGSCRNSDITIFSFHPVKIITSGEGGMALSNDPELLDRMRLLRAHGVTKEPENFITQALGPWYYEQQVLGFNYRMTDIHAALGLSQLKRVELYVERRIQIARKYNSLLQHLPLNLPQTADLQRSSTHLYPILCNDRNTRRRLFETLRTAGFGVNVHYMPIYQHPFYARLNFYPGYCLKAEEYYDRAISLPIFPNLCFQDQVRIVEQLENFFGSRK